MELNVALINGHKQITEVSCVPMSVECVLKLLELMPVTDFPFQNDPFKSGNSHWVKDLAYPPGYAKIKFSRQFLLSDIDIGLKDRGPHFNYDNLFKTIDEELSNNRYVIISLESDPVSKSTHNEVIYKRISESEYEIVTFYYDQPSHTILHQDLKARVIKMEGTDILTYKEIK